MRAVLSDIRKSAIVFLPVGGMQKPVWFLYKRISRYSVQCTSVTRNVTVICESWCFGSAGVSVATWSGKKLPVIFSCSNTDFLTHKGTLISLVVQVIEENDPARLPLAKLCIHSSF